MAFAVQFPQLLFDVDFPDDTLALPYRSAVLNTLPAAYYRLQEASGTSFAEEQGHAAATGSGTISSYRQPSPVASDGYSLVLGASGAIASGVPYSAVATDLSSQGISFGIWVKPSALLRSLVSGGGTNAPALALESDGKASITKSGTGVGLVKGTTVFSLGTWYFVLLVVDSYDPTGGGTTTAHLYVNGVEEATRTGMTLDDWAGNAPRFGDNSLGIAALTQWQRALTPAEVASIYGSANPASFVPPATAFTDLSGMVRDVGTAIGRQQTLNRIEAGGASVTVEDTMRALEPEYADGLYYPNVVPMRLARLRANAGGPATPLSLAGGEITDAIRALGVQGDGRLNDGSLGIWPPTTNLFTNGGFETNLNGWATVAPNTIARDTTRARFGSASAKLTRDNGTTDSDAGYNAISLTAAVYTGSLYVWIPSDYDGSGVALAAEQFTGMTPARVQADMSKRDQWQRLAVTFTPDPGDLLGNLAVRLDGASTGKSVWIDAVQVEAGYFATPYIHTDGATASRAAGGVQTGVWGLSGTQGWLLATWRPGFDRDASPNPWARHTLLRWNGDANNFIRLHYREADKTFVLQRWAAKTMREAVIAAPSFTHEDVLTVIGSWTAGGLRVTVGSAPAAVRFNPGPANSPGAFGSDLWQAKYRPSAVTGMHPIFGLSPYDENGVLYPARVAHGSAASPQTVTLGSGGYTSSPTALPAGCVDTDANGWPRLKNIDICGKIVNANVATTTTAVDATISSVASSVQVGSTGGFVNGVAQAYIDGYLCDYNGTDATHLLNVVTHDGTTVTTWVGSAVKQFGVVRGSRRNVRIHPPEADGLTPFQAFLPAPLQLPAPGRTNLNGALTAGAAPATVTVVSTASFPASGAFVIGSNQGTYTGKTGTTFTGVTWLGNTGAGNVVDASYRSGAQVTVGSGNDSSGRPCSFNVTVTDTSGFPVGPAVVSIGGVAEVFYLNKSGSTLLSCTNVSFGSHAGILVPAGAFVTALISDVVLAVSAASLWGSIDDDGVQMDSRDLWLVMPGSTKGAGGGAIFLGSGSTYRNTYIQATQADGLRWSNGCGDTLVESWCAHGHPGYQTVSSSPQHDDGSQYLYCRNGTMRRGFIFGMDGNSNLYMNPNASVKRAVVTGMVAEHMLLGGPGKGIQIIASYDSGLRESWMDKSTIAVGQNWFYQGGNNTNLTSSAAINDTTLNVGATTGFTAVSNTTLASDQTVSAGGSLTLASGGASALPSFRGYIALSDSASGNQCTLSYDSKSGDVLSGIRILYQQAGGLAFLAASTTVLRALVSMPSNSHDEVVAIFYTGKTSTTLTGVIGVKYAFASGTPVVPGAANLGVLSASVNVINSDNFFDDGSGLVTQDAAYGGSQLETSPPIPTGLGATLDLGSVSRASDFLYGDLRYVALGTGAPADTDTAGLGVIASAEDTTALFNGALAPTVAARMVDATTEVPTTFPIFRGVIDSFPVDWTLRRANVSLAIADLMTVLGSWPLSATFPAQLSSARINAILDRIGWPAAARAIDTGQETLAGETVSGTTGLAYLQLTADSENGLFFVGPDGTATFHSRDHRTTATRSTVSQGLFGDGGPATTELPYVSLAMDYPTDQLWNQLTVTYGAGGAASVTVNDFPSQRRYGIRTLQQRDTRLSTSAAALAQANAIIARLKDPHIRFTSMELDPTRVIGLLEKVLGLAISDRITVVKRPYAGGVAITKDCFVERLEQRIALPNGGPNSWRTPLQLSTV